MSQTQSLSIWDTAKIVGIAGLTLALNHLIRNLSQKKHSKPKKGLKTECYPQVPQLTSVKSLLEDEQLKSTDLWGKLDLKDIPQHDALLKQLETMTKLMCSFVKVNNLIVDLQINNVKTFPCPLIARQPKTNKDMPFLDIEALVKPGEFVIENCVFRSGQSVEIEKKFMRAGPRETQYFDPKTVRADIVVLGKVAPGINNIIRELVILLMEIYKVEVVTGIKFGFKGYYDSNMINLNPHLVETIHHRGGSYLGVSSSEQFFPERIVNSLVERGVNQLYLIGGNDTIRHSISLYKEIKKRKLNIALCVSLKAINKDIAYFDTCFGFESAVQETQRFVEEGYALGKSNFNTVVLIKVPGRYSGFLAMDAVRAARNVNICLVPEFQFDLYGENGLLKYIYERVKLKGNCIVVYSEGVCQSIRDIHSENNAFEANENGQHSFDIFLKKLIEKDLTKRGLNTHCTFLFDALNAVRTVPANSFDTKLCCQIALCSIQGLMSGYTNFAIGHLKNRVAMVPLEHMVAADKYCLRPYEDNWQRLLATTGQPSFVNEQHKLAEEQ